MKIIVKSPTGVPIVGTAESLLATAHIQGFSRDKNGKLAFDYAGDSNIHWDTQETKKDKNGQTLFEDENGDEWPEGALVVTEATDK